MWAPTRLLDLSLARRALSVTLQRLQPLLDLMLSCVLFVQLAAVAQVTPAPVDVRLVHKAHMDQLQQEMPTRALHVGQATVPQAQALQDLTHPRVLFVQSVTKAQVTPVQVDVCLDPV